jgi:hypothetical protein
MPEQERSSTRYRRESFRGVIQGCYSTPSRIQHRNQSPGLKPPAWVVSGGPRTSEGRLMTYADVFPLEKNLSGEHAVQCGGRALRRQNLVTGRGLGRIVTNCGGQTRGREFESLRARQSSYCIICDF